MKQKKILQLRFFAFFCKAKRVLKTNRFNDLRSWLYLADKICLFLSDKKALICSHSLQPLKMFWQKNCSVKIKQKEPVAKHKKNCKSNKGKMNLILKFLFFSDG